MQRRGGVTRHGAIADRHPLLLPMTLGAQARIAGLTRCRRHSRESRLRRRSSDAFGCGVAIRFARRGTDRSAWATLVTAYLFTYDDVLSRVVHAGGSASRQRFQPPVSVARPSGDGDPRTLAGSSTSCQHRRRSSPSSSSWCVPGGRWSMSLPPAARSGAYQFFHAVADSSWQAYLRPTGSLATDRAKEIHVEGFLGNLLATNGEILR